MNEAMKYICVEMGEFVYWEAFGSYVLMSGLYLMYLIPHKLRVPQYW